MSELIKQQDQATLTSALEKAKTMAAIVPTDAESATLANQNLKIIATTARDLDKLRKTYTDPLNKQQKAIKAEFDVVINQLKDHRAKLEKAHFAYQRKVEEAERKRVEEQMRLDEERKAREAAAEAERAKLSPAAAELMGELDEPEPAPVAPPPTVQAGLSSGVQTRSTIAVEIVDAKAVLQAIVDGILPMEVVDINDKAIARWVKNSKADTVPGCKVSEKKVIAA